MSCAGWEANDNRSSERRLHAISLFSRKNFSSKFGDNISLVGMSWGQKFTWRLKNIALKMLLLPGNKSGDSFNFCLQKCIVRWEPSLTNFGIILEEMQHHTIDHTLTFIHCLLIHLLLLTLITQTRIVGFQWSVDNRDFRANPKTD